MWKNQYPDYVDYRIRRVMDEYGIVILEPNKSIPPNKNCFHQFSFIDTRNAGGSLVGIEAPKKTQYDTYTANVAMLYEIGKEQDKNFAHYFSAYHRELRAWRNAEHIRNKIAFPVLSGNGEISWNTIRCKAISVYEPLRIRASEWLRLFTNTAGIFIALVSCFGLFFVLYKTEGKIQPTAILQIFGPMFQSSAPFAAFISFLLAWTITKTGRRIRAKFSGVSVKAT